jgi:SAM-dependent methyltransferase
MSTQPTDHSTRTVSRDWFASAFDDLYPVVYKHRTVAAAEPEARFSLDQVRIRPNDVVLDLACGAGRHMHYLLEATPHVTGLDYSAALLRRADSLLNGRGHLVRGDMRHLPFEACFDVLATYFTTFGYFGEEENQQTACCAARALRPGGRFFIDYLNPDHVRATLDPASVRCVGGYEVREDRWIDEQADRVNKKTTVLRDGEQVTESEESVRLYDEPCFRTLLERAGLETTAVFGDYEGNPVHKDRPRMIFVGHRKG